MYAPTDAAAATRAARHDLAWLNHQGWEHAIAAARPEHRTALARWQKNDWPAVVRRRDADAGPDQVCLGIPLPPALPSGEKVRIALRAERVHIRRTTPPLPLRAAPMGGELAALHALTQPAASTAEVTLHVYGSFAMQVLTGEAYLTPSSDIDLLFYPTRRPQLDAGLALLAAHAQSLPLDGEIVFPGGAAVSWKEWLQAAASRSRVLVKDLHTVRLAEPAQLLAMLESRP
jgi:phosphoribosyl-dephospho-CoA transferase